MKHFKITITTLLLIWQDRHAKHVYSTAFEYYHNSTRWDKVNTRLYWLWGRLSPKFRGVIKERRELLTRAQKQHRLHPSLFWITNKVRKVNTAMYDYNHRF